MPGTGGIRTGESRIPGPTVSRLPVYHRALERLVGERRATVSSSELALASGVNAATLRRDLCRLGSLGTPGRGYEVSHLLARVDRALALDRSWPVAIVGAGNLGRALTGFWGLAAKTFPVVALFDVAPALVGTSVGGIRIAHLDELPTVVSERGVAIGVVATPPGAAQTVVDRLVASGVGSILNFAPATLAAPEPVNLRHVDLAAELQVLAFYGARSAVSAPQAGRVRPLPAAQ